MSVRRASIKHTRERAAKKESKGKHEIHAAKAVHHAAEHHPAKHAATHHKKA